MCLMTANEPPAQIDAADRCESSGTTGRTSDEYQEHRETAEVLSRLGKSTAWITRFSLISVSAMVAWFALHLVVGPGTELGSLIRFPGVLILMAPLITWYWLSLYPRGEEQRRALEELRELSESDPKAIEVALPGL